MLAKELDILNQPWTVCKAFSIETEDCAAVLDLQSQEKDRSWDLNGISPCESEWVKSRNRVQAEPQVRCPPTTPVSCEVLATG